jgi:hypothetical protein
MREDLEPIVGKWYLDVQEDEIFRVMAIDEDREIVEIRYADGETDEVELDVWGDLDLDVAEPPEDASLDQDDDDEPRASGWREPREGGEREPEEDWDEDEEDDDEDDEDDDWDDEEKDDR